MLRACQDCNSSRLRSTPPNKNDLTDITGVVAVVNVIASERSLLQNTRNLLDAILDDNVYYVQVVSVLFGVCFLRLLQQCLDGVVEQGFYFRCIYDQRHALFVTLTNDRLSLVFDGLLDSSDNRPVLFKTFLLIFVHCYPDGLVHLNGQTCKGVMIVMMIVTIP